MWGQLTRKSVEDTRQGLYTQIIQLGSVPLIISYEMSSKEKAALLEEGHG